MSKSAPTEDIATACALPHVAAKNADADFGHHVSSFFAITIENARQSGLPMIFDMDYRAYSWPSASVASHVLTRAGDESDMIVGNDEEFGLMTGGIDKGLA